jgi:hypothetical protein
MPEVTAERAVEVGVRMELFELLLLESLILAQDERWRRA